MDEKFSKVKYDIANGEVISGMLINSRLKKSLKEQHYLILKGFLWLGMINHQMRPTEWHQPSRNGTRVRFCPAVTEDQIDIALKEFALWFDAVKGRIDSLKDNSAMTEEELNAIMMR